MKILTVIALALPLPAFAQDLPRLDQRILESDAEYRERKLDERREDARMVQDQILAEEQRQTQELIRLNEQLADTTRRDTEASQ